MKKVKVAVLDDYDGSISRLPCWKTLAAEFEVEFFQEAQEPKKLVGHEIIVTVRERTIVDKPFLSQLPNLKHLAVTGRLSGQADLEELKRRQITASYTDGSGQSPAELTIALLLGISKGLHHKHNLVQQGGWQNGPGLSLAGKTLGVLGLGRIGTKVALFGKFMEMNVVSWGPTEDNGRSQKLDLRRTDLDEVLRASDYICICLRLSQSTRSLLDQPKLALLKNGAALVNTSRAEIIEKNALYAELASGRINGAFDVFHREPLLRDDPMRALPNVLLSPHMGYATREVYEIFFSQVCQNILAWKSGQKYRDALAT